MTTNYKGQEPDLFVIPTYVPGYGKWINKIRLVADGDPGSEASLAIAGMGLADRTMWLAHRILDIRAGGSYDTAPISITGFWVFQGETDFYDLRCTAGSWVKLEPARTTKRNEWDLVSTTNAGSLFAGYVPHSIVHANGYTRPVLQTDGSAVAARESIVRINDLPIGWTLQNVTVTAEGIGDTAGATVSTYQIIRWQGSAAAEDLSTAQADNHTGGDWTTVKARVVAANASITIESGWQYGVRVIHAYAPGLSAMRYWNFEANLEGGIIKL